ncbi:ArnT family glycosyltransferase [Candidatus Poribacteria bacterium]
MEKVLSISKLWRYLIIALICLSPFAFLFYQAWYSPKIEFLVPSFRGDWILHSANKLSGIVEFRRRFQLRDIPAKCEIRVRAMMQFSIAVNGQTVEVDSQREEHNWKSARRYDIASMLQKADNAIIIRVSNPEGPPALLVEGPTLGSPEGKIKLSSDTNWEAAPDPNFDQWVSVVPTLKDKARLEEKKGPIQKSPRYAIYIIAFAVYVIFILLAIKPWRIFHRPDSDIPPRAPGRRRLLSSIPFLVIIVIVLIINVHNTAIYSHERSGFDWKGHVEYIRYMASNWRTPIATEGWEMFQPPLYYFLSAIIYKLFGGAAAEPGSLKAVQIMGTFSGVANACFAWLVLRKLFKENYLIQLLGFSVVAFLSMCFYMNPLISNEIFSGSVISLAIYMLIRYGFKKRVRIHQALILGAVVGLALLSKYTAAFVFLTAVTILMIRVLTNPSTRRREVTALAVFLIVVFALSGWLYIRNLVKFHDPFIGNWDQKSGYHYEQHHGYRTLGFYLKFGSVFFHKPERSRWASFWDGKYGSMWMDTHGSFLKTNDDQANLYGSIIIYLALLPSVSILLGFCQSLRSAFKSARCNPNFALIMVFVLTFISLLSFTMEVPFFSTIKAFFYLSLLPVIAVFAGKGLYTMSRNLGKFRFILYANLIVLYMLIARLFWYRGT